jgi:hypothetical protein
MRRSSYGKTRPKQPEADRFWSKVRPEPGGECWLWTGRLDRDGYGQFHRTYVLAERKAKPIPAHRWAWESHFGPIPDGLLVCHKCDVPACVNPAHLFLGTQLDNRRDCKSKCRTARGTGHGLVKLNDDKVREIRARYAAGERQRALAGEFGVVQTMISSIVRRKTWTHIPNEQEQA